MNRQVMESESTKEALPFLRSLDASMSPQLQMNPSTLHTPAGDMRTVRPSRTVKKKNSAGSHQAWASGMFAALRVMEGVNSVFAAVVRGLAQV